MNRFTRSTAIAGAAVVALVLAIAASATTGGSDRTAAPSAGAAVTNYLTYVHGKRGKANPKKSKIYIGWVNQQGGQVVIGGLATAGAELAVKYVNDQLGGVDGHPVALVECFVKSNEEEGTTCGQKLVNDKRISVIASGAVATGAQSFFATIRGAKPVVSGVAITPIDGGQKNAVVLFGDAGHILLPFGTYAKNVLKAKTAAVVYPQATGITEAGAGDRSGPEEGRDRDEGRRLHAGSDRPDGALDRSRRDNGGLHRPLRLGVGLREPGEGPQAARHHRLAQDHDRAALPQPAGDRRARRLSALDVRDRVVALRRSDGQGHARLPGGDQEVQGREERSGSVAHRRVRPAPRRPSGSSTRPARATRASRRRRCWRARKRSRGRSRSGRRSSSAASTRPRRASATTCSRRSPTRASSRSSGRPAGSGRPSSA